jgi:hypothetical protein
MGGGLCARPLADKILSKRRYIMISFIKHPKYIMPWIFLICISNYHCNESSPLETKSDYPTTIKSLSNTELQKLKDEFDKSNDYTINANFNKYGFIGTGASIISQYNSNIKLSRDSVIKIIAHTLMSNKKYTNVYGESEIISNIKDVINLNNNNWKIEIGNQKYDNLEVLNSNINAYLSGDKVYCIINSWYPKAIIPSKNLVSPTKAKEKLVGLKIQMNGFYPTGSYLTVKENLIGEIYKKVIFPYEKENSLELRIAWEIPIKYQDLIGWYVYLDTTTGEILGTNQIIIFN